MNIFCLLSMINSTNSTVTIIDFALIVAKVIRFHFHFFRLQNPIWKTHIYMDLALATLFFSLFFSLREREIFNYCSSLRNTWNHFFLFLSSLFFLLVLISFVFLRSVQKTKRKSILIVETLFFSLSLSLFLWQADRERKTKRILKKTTVTCVNRLDQHYCCYFRCVWRHICTEIWISSSEKTCLRRISFTKWLYN